MVIAPVQQCHLDLFTTKNLRRGQPSEPAANDHDMWG
jgi:hypothetical protein